MRRTQIQLTDAQLEGLKALAAERGISIAAVIRDLAEREVAGLAAAREKAIGSVGGFRSGGSDAGEDHDRYLSDAFAK